MKQPRLFSPEEHTLAHLCRISPPTHREEQPYLLPLHRCFPTAANNRLLPLLFDKKSKDPSLFADLSKQEQQALQEAYQSNALLAMVQDALLHQLHSLFEPDHIDFLLYKGSAYRSLIYADPALRPMVDLDLLIKPSSLPRVISILERNQWEHQVVGHPTAQFFTHPTHPTFLDIHTHPGWPYQTRIPQEELFQSRQKLPNGPFYTTDAISQLLLHIYHQCRHQYVHEYLPLLSFVELRELFLRVESQAQQVMQRAERWGLQKMLACGLFLLETLYPGLLTPPWQASEGFLSILARLIRAPWHLPSAPEKHAKLLLRGAFLYSSIDHPSDQIRYFLKRSQLKLRKALSRDT